MDIAGFLFSSPFKFQTAPIYIPGKELKTRNHLLSADPLLTTKILF